MLTSNRMTIQSELSLRLLGIWMPMIWIFSLSKKFNKVLIRNQLQTTAYSSELSQSSDQRCYEMATAFLGMHFNVHHNTIFVLLKLCLTSCMELFLLMLICELACVIICRPIGKLTLLFMDFFLHGIHLFNNACNYQLLNLLEIHWSEEKN